MARRITEAPRTADEHINSLTMRIERLERRSPNNPFVYVQPNEPDDVAIGTLWFDTDEPVPG